MMSDKISTILATIATVCWCIQLIPQIYSNWRRKDCTGFPPIMMYLWVLSGIPFGIYFCIIRANIVLQIQPHVFMFFCFISFIQACYYPPVEYNKKTIILVLSGTIVLDLSLELPCILTLRPLYDRGIKWPALIFGISAVILLIVGFLPVYIDLLKRKGRVVGINFVFLFIDSLGAWLSIISVIFGKFDTLGIILYSCVAVMEVGIAVSHLIWYLRYRFNKDTEDNEELEMQCSSINEKVSYIDEQKK
ncbi:hypothetical protein TPHA_0A06080 [Tetrapisispora phaffii CBS 4417]|uniref:PQ loop repeat protein n=1 Tax=Tetrapisispora phaffii (strain ATCC 24235 / CBS 4417 / NBRC 1672 / NRRL Y-8282 / UCD 70-5) TaxID=1071381 RepID=G8BP53_TETPH|nr:hypothetical protein TPHA_0A06080 [Tetrapisispora phaffii CBS 4417]CCE61681.1 hypothetical protein TPHA_0A06080 [Tetrapisispora phaffii CBS 4417]